MKEKYKQKTQIKTKTQRNRHKFHRLIKGHLI